MKQKKSNSLQPQRRAAQAIVANVIDPEGSKVAHACEVFRAEGVNAL